MQRIGEKYSEPDEVEEGKQMEAVALAALRRGMRFMPFVPSLPFAKPDRDEGDHPATMPGRQLDLFDQQPDLFDRV